MTAFRVRQTLPPNNGADCKPNCLTDREGACGGAHKWHRNIRLGKSHPATLANVVSQFDVCSTLEKTLLVIFG
jgi:hypothetical protein